MAVFTHFGGHDLPLVATKKSSMQEKPCHTIMSGAAMVCLPQEMNEGKIVA